MCKLIIIEPGLRLRQAAKDKEWEVGDPKWAESLCKNFVIRVTSL